MPNIIPGTNVVPKSSIICPTIAPDEMDNNKEYIRLRYISRDGPEKEEYVEVLDQEYDIIMTCQGETVQGHSKPSWVRVYKKDKNGEYIFKGDAVLKSANDGHIEYAQFPAPVHELLFSKLANLMLPEDCKIRVPEIDAVLLNGEDEPKTLSYNIAQDGANLFLMEYILFSSEEIIEPQRISTQSTLCIDEVLERVKAFLGQNIIIQVQNVPIRNPYETFPQKIERKTNEQYAIIEEEILTVLVIDSMLNNADRHGLNWGLVLDEHKNWHVAIWDHETSMVGLACNSASRPGWCWNSNWNGYASLPFSTKEARELEKRKAELDERGEKETDEERRKRIFMLPLYGNKFIKYCMKKNPKVFEKIFSQFDSDEKIELFIRELASVFPIRGGEFKNFSSVVLKKLEEIKEMRKKLLENVGIDPEK